MRERGFTLIEVMVALAVFSLAALALIRLEGVTVRGASTVERTLVASMVAGNVATESLTDARAPVLGRTTGAEVNGGVRWRWRRDVGLLGDAGALRIDVAVADPSGTVLARATEVRRGGPTS